MKRIIVVVAILASTGLYALSREVEPALACSGPGPTETMLEATVIFEGRVAAVTPSGSKGFDRSPHAVTFDVVRGYEGVEAGARVVANAMIPVPGVPIMCPQFPQNLAGKYVVIGLRPDVERPGELLADAWVMPYIGDEPGGPMYAEAVGLARMHADSNPLAPQLILTPTVATCGGPLLLSGRRFPAGRYLLRYGMSQRFIGLTDAGVNGAFDIQTTMFADVCRNPVWNGRAVSVHVYDIRNGPDWAFRDFHDLVEIGRIVVRGAVEAPYPTLTVNPNPARCSDILEVRGTGFLPGEQLNLGVGYGARDALVTADGTGSFVASHEIPDGACDESLIEVLVNQAGYEAYTPPFYGLARVSVIRAGPPSQPPGPPDLGTGPGAASADEALSSFGPLVVLLVLFGAVVVAFVALNAKRAA